MQGGACAALRLSSKHAALIKIDRCLMKGDDARVSREILILCQIFSVSSSERPSGSNCSNYSQFN